MDECPGQERQYANAILDRRSQHPEFAYFVRPWLERATDPEPFAALINLWVAFNSWLCEIITVPEFIDADAALISAAAKDIHLCVRLQSLLNDDPAFRQIAEEFRSLFPVFNVRALDQKGIGSWNSWNASRDEYRERCFNENLKSREYKPRCWWGHQARQVAAPGGSPDALPLDWPHLLSSVYQVRCNLFHGGKSFRVESDVQFARLAFQVLWQVWGSQFLL